MKIYNSGNIATFIALVLLSFSTLSCDDLVEDGYRIDYPASDAVLSIEPIGYEMGAAGDIVSYSITANSANAIKSLVIVSNQPGDNGTGYDVGSVGFDDPFADHVYGTIRKNVTSFTVKYDYVIPADINKSKLVFSLIDEQGKVSSEINIKAISSIKRYTNKSLFTKDDLNFDAFATNNGIVYQDIKTNYSTDTETNLTVQDNIDIVFYVSSTGNSTICAPNSSALSVSLKIENATKFKRMSSISVDDFDSITPASLVELTAPDSIGYNGRSGISSLKVNDIIGFTTDLNAVHSFKTGLIKVNALHPTNVGRYDGTAYVLDCDIITQIDE